MESISKSTPSIPEQEVRASQPNAITLDDFFAYMPAHQYLYVPTRELWPASSVDGRLPPVKVNGKPVSPSEWLDNNRPVEQMTWTPAEPEIIRDKVSQISGWVPHAGATVFNQYRAPNPPGGRPDRAGPWLEHVRRVYPDDADHIINWMAQRVQRPGVKCNHALVLGGLQGIGKDTLLEPLKAAVGPWNWSEINPTQMLGRFNGWAKAVVVRISEARDLGDLDRYAFYDHSKTIIATPPDVIRVDEKYLRETYVANVAGVIITTNNASDGLYLPADDRRHYVTWSPCTKDSFPDDYWNRLYGWYGNDGIGHVCAYLQKLDISGFDPKAPPPKTPAFWQIVATGEAPESGELRDLLELMGNPDAVATSELILKAETFAHAAFADELKDRKSRRKIPHRMEQVGYVPVRNPGAEDGLFKVSGKRQVIYAKRQLPLAEQLRAARAKS